ncbi:MAG: ribulokinase [Spirochaetales bacterium]|nr:ribulokinase [Spirochaetales bacterium]
MSEQNYVIGLDYGSDSVRSLIVDATNGNEIASAVFYYPRWKEGKYCNAAVQQFRQHPLDYIEGLEFTIKEALGKAPAGTARKIKGISVDTTGSTPVAVNAQGRPLALTPGFEENPNAMFVLWKDHTAIKEADQINHRARTWGGVDYTKFVGGVYSSEWFWAKILHVMREDARVAEAAASWVEHCDWIPALLTGQTDVTKVKRSRCAAGHKAMWHESFNGLPSEEFWAGLDPLLKGVRAKLYSETTTCEKSVGIISKEWAGKLGLPENVEIAAGSFDAHLGAIGSQIEAYHMSKVMGTSTCDMVVAPMDEVGDTLVGGICGQVDGSIIPHMMGLEAGQSSFGDLYAWFRNMLLWPLEKVISQSTIIDKATAKKLRDEAYEMIIPALTKEAEALDPASTKIVSLDWLNGRRTPFANQKLTASITGLHLGADAPRIFLSLVQATAFGARRILEQFEKQGIPVKGVIGLGGVSKKSPFIMQVMADVLQRPIRIARSEQACALGAAMAASVAAGIHPNITRAQNVMGGGFEKEYQPDSSKKAVYDELYKAYNELGAFMEKQVEGDAR